MFKLENQIIINLISIAILIVGIPLILIATYILIMFCMSSIGKFGTVCSFFNLLVIVFGIAYLATKKF